MKKKINARMVLVAVLGILATMALLLAVFHKLFQRQMIADLRVYALLLEERDSKEEMRRQGEIIQKEGVRITLLDDQGDVLYDNQTDSAAMENHRQRPEVRSAMEEGEGQAVRRSATLDKSTFYYTIRLTDGRVLRVATEAESIYSILSSALPSLVWIAAVLVLLSFLLAHYLTESLVEPIEKLADHLDDGTEITHYEELEPFIRTIQKQHRSIVENARLRQEFTANVSHELKTPLTSISGYAELIET
ncbi:MAG: two-component sensor histidine kinase, partial [Acetatifactor sp.]|nr:two-component sensor histidine kinase [Acetatifactor sp.]